MPPDAARHAPRQKHLPAWSRRPAPPPPAALARALALLRMPGAAACAPTPRDRRCRRLPALRPPSACQARPLLPLSRPGRPARRAPCAVFRGAGPSPRRGRRVRGWPQLAPAASARGVSGPLGRSCLPGGHRITRLRPSTPGEGLCQAAARVRRPAARGGHGWPRESPASWEQGKRMGEARARPVASTRRWPTRSDYRVGVSEVSRLAPRRGGRWARRGRSRSPVFGAGAKGEQPGRTHRGCPGGPSRRRWTRRLKRKWRQNGVHGPRGAGPQSWGALISPDHSLCPWGDPGTGWELTNVLAAPGARLNQGLGVGSGVSRWGQAASWAGQGGSWVGSTSQAGWGRSPAGKERVD